jgi:PAS domain S-box-containing protein
MSHPGRLPTQRLKIGTFRWAIAVFCAVLGALMLVIPHQFGTAYGFVQYYLPWLGGLYVATGTALLGVSVLKPGRRLIGAIHFFAGVANAILALAFAQSQAWAGAAVYGMLAVGTMLAPLIAVDEDATAPTDTSGTGDLFAFLMGAIAIVSGVSLLLFPQPFGGLAPSSTQPFLAPISIALLVLGSALVLSQVRVISRTITLAAFLGVASMFVVWFVVAALPNRLWSGIVLFGGFGLILALLPWAGPRLRRLDPTSLRTRLSLALAIAAALPVIGTVSLAAGRDERFQVAEALQMQQILAIALAQDVSDYVGLHIAAVEALSTYPELRTLAPESQRRLLSDFARSFPEVIDFGTYDANGQPIARSGPGELFSLATAPTFLEVQRTNARAIDLTISPVFGRPVFILASPIRDGDGRFAGAAIGVLESARLAELLDRTMPEPASQAYLVDAQGRVLAHPRVSLGAWFADLSTHPPVGALLRGNGQPGMLSYVGSAGEQLTGFAGITPLRWGVVVEQPISIALAGTYASRESALLVLFVVIAIAALIGLVAAERLVEPLRALSVALDAFAAGNARAPLPAATTSEVSHLAQVFDEMRDRLATRTAEQERAEVALRRSEEEYRRIVETAQEGVVALDVNGYVRFVNQRMAQLLGYSVEEMIGTPIYQYMDDEGRRITEAHLARRREGMVEQYDFTYRARDGSERWVIVSANPLLDQEGNYAGALAMVADRSERKRADDRLRLLSDASTELTSSLEVETTLANVARLTVPSLADWCVVDVVEPDGSVVVVGAASRAEWGYEENLPRVGNRRSLPEAHPVMRAIATGRGERFETILEEQLHRLVRDERDIAFYQRLGMTSAMYVPMVARGRTLGTITLCSAGSRRHYDEQDLALAEELARRSAMAVDNARLYREARAAEEELRRQFEFSSAISANLAEGVCAVDTEGMVTFANRAAELLLGWSATELLGRDLQSVVAIQTTGGSQSESQEFPVPNVLETGATRHGSGAVFRRRDGAEFPVDFSSSPIRAEGQIVGAVLTFRDITDRQRMEEELLRAQRLETAGRIAGEVAHDFNNLLAPMVGFPELIKMRLPEGHPAIEFCDMMVSAAQQMAEINENLLALGRRGHFEYSPLNLNRLVQEAVDTLAPAGSRPPTLDIRLELAPDVMPVKGAAAQLVRVITNLVTNAREAMEDRGQLTLRTQNVYLDVSGGQHSTVEIGEYVRLDVSDTGAGIPEALQDKVFDAFFTTRTSGRRRGSGLGLSVVQTIVTDHGGTIDLLSEEDVGTTFSLYLPVCREEVEAETRDEAPGGDESILIVDDDPVQREVARHLLESLGYQVDAVASGERAVSYVAQQPIDLLILDMLMEPGIDGTETFRRIRELHPHQRALIVSGFAESERVSQALLLGAGASLRKPVTRQALAQAVREVLDLGDGGPAARGVSPRRVGSPEG